MVFLNLSLIVGNKNGDISSEEIEIERIDEAEFRRKEPLSPSMRSFSTWQGYNEGDSADYCSENGRGTSKNISLSDYYESCPSKDVGRNDYDEEKLDFTKKCRSLFN